MDDTNLKQAAQLLVRAKQRLRKDDADAKRNDSPGNVQRAAQSQAFYNGVVETLGALGIRQEVEQAAV